MEVYLLAAAQGRARRERRLPRLPTMATSRHLAIQSDTKT